MLVEGNVVEEMIVEDEVVEAGESVWITAIPTGDDGEIQAHFPTITCVTRLAAAAHILTMSNAS